MSKIPILLSALALSAFACQHPQQSVQVTPKVVAIGIDVSTSTGDFYTLLPQHLDSLHNRMARQGGGEVYVFLIQTNSAFQQPLKAVVEPAQPLLEETGIPPRREKIRLENNRRRAAAQEQKAQFMNRLRAVLARHATESHTDIDGALALMNTLLNENRFRFFQKEIILVTDGLQDLPQKGRTPVQALKLNVQRIHLVRPLDSSLPQILGKYCTVSNHTTIDDAILSI